MSSTQILSQSKAKPSRRRSRDMRPVTFRGMPAKTAQALAASKAKSPKLKSPKAISPKKATTKIAEPDLNAPDDALSFQDLILYSELLKRHEDPQFNGDFYKADEEDLEDVLEWRHNEKGRPTKADLQELIENLPQKARWEPDEDKFVWKAPARPKNWKALLEQASTKPDGFDFVQTSQAPNQALGYQDLVLYSELSKRLNDNDGKYKDDLFKRGEEDLKEVQGWIENEQGRPTRADLELLLAELPQEATFDPGQDDHVWQPPKLPANWQARMAEIEKANAVITAAESLKEASQLRPRNMQVARKNPLASRLQPAARFSAAKISAANVLCEGLDCQPCRVTAGIMAKPGSSQIAPLGGPHCLWCETVFPQGTGSEAAKTHVRRHHRLELLMLYGLKQAKTCQVGGQNYLMIPLKKPAFKFGRALQALPPTVESPRRKAYPKYTELSNNSGDELDDGPSNSAGQQKNQLSVREQLLDLAPGKRTNTPESNAPRRPNGWRMPGSYRQHLVVQPHHQKIIDEGEPKAKAVNKPRRGAIAARGTKAATPQMEASQPVSEKARGKQRALSANTSLHSSQISPKGPVRSTKRKASYVAPYVEEEDGTISQAAKRRRTSSGSQPLTPKSPLASTVEAVQAETIKNIVATIQSFQKETRGQSQDIAVRKAAEKDVESQALARDINDCAINTRADYFEKSGKHAQVKGTLQAEREAEASEAAEGEAAQDGEQVLPIEEADAGDSQDSPEQHHDEAVEDLISEAESNGDEDYVPEADMYCSRCLRKAPKLNDRSKGKSNLGRDVEMKFHSNPNRSCRIKNGVGHATGLPNQSGWIPAKSLPQPINRIKSNFIEAHPEYKATIYPPKNTTTLWKFDPNNESNKQNWGLTWPPVSKAPAAKSTAGQKRKRNAETAAKDDASDFESASAFTEEVSEYSGDEIEVQSDDAGPLTRASKKRKLIARKAEADGTYRPSIDEERDTQDVPSAEAVAEEIREAGLTTTSVPATPGLPSAAAKKRKRLPHARNTDSSSSSEEEAAGSPSPKKRKKVATTGRKDTNYRPRKDNDDDDIDAEPTAEEVAAEIQKPLPKMAKASDSSFLFASQHESSEAGLSAAVSEQEDSPQFEGFSEKLPSEERTPSPESEEAQSDKQTEESWENAPVGEEAVETVAAEEEEPVQKPARAKGLGSLFAWRNHSPSKA